MTSPTSRNTSLTPISDQMNIGLSPSYMNTLLQRQQSASVQDENPFLPTLKNVSTVPPAITEKESFQWATPFKKLFGSSVDPQTGEPVGGVGLGALNFGLDAFKAWQGMQQLNLMEDQLATNKEQFSLNFNNAADLTNANLRDRQVARNAANSSHMATDIYMDKYGVSKV